MNEMAPLLQTAKPVVLLVDDSEDILDYLAHDFSRKYQTYTARDGNAAIATMQREEIQLVVSDVMMPKMDGFELCEKIKSSPGLSHIPVILLTAKNTYQSKIQGLKLGADAYIEKPFFARSSSRADGQPAGEPYEAERIICKISPRAHQ